MTDERLQSSFWLSEFLRSDMAVRHGIDNTPNASALASIRNVLAPGMQRVRNCLGAPVLITSGYRCLHLNRLLRSADDSRHVLGLAADFAAASFGTPRAISRYLMERSGEIRFRTLIFEGQWVHVDFAGPGETLHTRVLTAHFPADGGRPTYTPGVD